jgi:hypothetical protein
MENDIPRVLMKSGVVMEGKYKKCCNGIIYPINENASFMIYEGRYTRQAHPWRDDLI